MMLPMCIYGNTAYNCGNTAKYGITAKYGNTANYWNTANGNSAKYGITANMEFCKILKHC